MTLDGTAIATIAAIILGPIAAVLITRWLDDRRLQRQRRMDVFRTLMRTRRMVLTPDHVGALNLVEIEFHRETDVISAWKAYWSNLEKKIPPDMPLNEIEQFIRQRDGLLAKLLHAIGKSLGFGIEQLDIFEGGYVPQGWETEYQEQRAIRQALLEVLQGQRAFPVTPVQRPTPGGPFPPAP